MGTLKNYKVTWGVYNDFHRVNEGTHYVKISSEIIQSESKEEIVMRDWGGGNTSCLNIAQKLWKRKLTVLRLHP